MKIKLLFIVEDLHYVQGGRKGESDGITHSDIP